MSSSSVVDKCPQSIAIDYDRPISEVLGKATVCLRQKFFQAKFEQELSITLSFPEGKKLCYSRIIVIQRSRSGSRGISSPRGSKIEKRVPISKLMGTALSLDEFISFKEDLARFNVPVDHYSIKHLETKQVVKLSFKPILD